MTKPARPPVDPDSPKAAYLLGLRWLAARELTSAQISQRLERRGFSPRAIGPALERLTRERALDDRRAALASARTEATLRHHGPARILRRLQSMGIDRDLAREIVREIFGELDERALMQRALAKRLRPGASLIRDRAQLRRLHAYLVREGFSSSAAVALLRGRSARGTRSEDD